VKGLKNLGRYTGRLIGTTLLEGFLLLFCCKGKDAANYTHIGSENLGDARIELYADADTLYGGAGESKKFTLYPIAGKKFSLFGTDTSQDNEKYQKRKKEGYKEQDWETKTSIGPYISPDSLGNRDYVKRTICQKLGLSPKSVSIETYGSEDLEKNMKAAAKFIDPSYPTDLKSVKSLLDAIMYDADSHNFDVWRNSENPLDNDIDWIGICNIIKEKSANIKVEAEYDGTVYTVKVTGQ
jgi:hypothetical protein